MTTIAYKDGIIAYDGRITSEGVIYQDDREKKHELDGLVFFYAGSESDRGIFMESYKTSQNKKDEVLNSIAYVLDDGVLYECAVADNKEFWKVKVDLDVLQAIGSGFKFAMAAMDCGKTAKEAIEITAKRDIYTGGKIRTFKISIK